MSGWRPNYLVLHDYGGTPKNQDGVFNPYHALVFPDGSIRYRNPSDPYGGRAPHAYRLNPDSVGLSYAGQVGSQPTPAALDALRKEYQSITKRFPGIKPMGHGEAYQATKGTNRQASRDGRDLNEASWRTEILRAPSEPPAGMMALGGATINRDGVTTTGGAAAPPPPVSQRGLTTHAGLAPPTAPSGAAGRTVIPANSPNATAALQSAYDAGNRSMTYIHDSNPRVVAKPGEAKWGPRDPNLPFSGPAFANEFLTGNPAYGAVRAPSAQPGAISAPAAPMPSPQQRPQPPIAAKPAGAALSMPPAPMGALAPRGGPPSPMPGTMHGFGVEGAQQQSAPPLPTQPTPVTPAQPAPRQEQPAASANIAASTPTPSPLATEVAPKPEAAPVTRAGASAVANVGSVSPAVPSGASPVDPTTKAMATALQSPTWEWHNGQLGVMWPGNKTRKPAFTGFGGS